jgi:hypothetical protein
MKINFYFTDFNGRKNFTESNEKTYDGEDRFTLSPLFNRMFMLKIDYKKHKKTIEIHREKKEIDEKYVIPVGVNCSPLHWAGGKFAEIPNVLYFDYEKPKNSLFDFLSPKYLKDLKKEKAFLMIDSSLEGYHEDWIFNFFHKECEKRGISPNQIIYVTGNSIVEERYKNWLKLNPQEIKINPLPYSHFENDVYREAIKLKELNGLPDIIKHIEYKSKNEIKLFNNLNRKPREHRTFLYIHLYEHNLLNSGLVSMNQFDAEGIIYFLNREIEYKLTQEVKKTLPALINNKSNMDGNSDYYINRLMPDICLDTWVSLVSETGYRDNEGTVFLSEKIFKPVACMHPFVVVGNKNSLVEFRKLGYESFSNWIDEDYDTKDDTQRIYAAVDAIEQVDRIENKLSWYKDMEEVLKHNFRILERNAIEEYPYAFKQIQKIVNG